MTFRSTDKVDDARALEVLREIWSANAQSGEEIEEQLRESRPKVCRNMRAIGFGGMDPSSEPTGPEGTNVPVDTDIRAAWRDRLDREGKLHPQAVSVGEMIDAGEPDGRQHG